MELYAFNISYSILLFQKICELYIWNTFITAWEVVSKSRIKKEICLNSMRNILRLGSM
jgi:hypothetical protein